MATYAAFASNAKDVDVTPKKRDPTASYDCPVCMEYLLPPIFQCFNGHALCNKCELQLNNCPVCRDELPKNKKIRNLILEDIVQRMLYDCKNYEQGCLVRLKYNQIEAHSWDCLFAELPICSYLGIKCDAKHTSKAVLRHLKSIHGLLGINFEKMMNASEADGMGTIPIEICQTASLSRLERSREIAVKPHYFLFRENSFFLTTTYDVKDKSVTWSVSILGSSLLAEQFGVRVKLMSREPAGINSVEWQGQVSELRSIAKPNLSPNQSQKPEANNNASRNIHDFTCFSIPVQKLAFLSKSHSSRESPSREASTSSPSSSRAVQNQSNDLISWRLHIQFCHLNEENNHGFDWVAKGAGIAMDSEISYDGHVPVQNSSNGVRGRPGIWIQREFAELEESSASASPSSALASPSASSSSTFSIPASSLSASIRHQIRKSNQDPNYNSFTGFYEEKPAQPQRTGYVYFQD